MIEFRMAIKRPLIKEFGTLWESYEKVRVVDHYDNDAVDRIIFKASLQLDDRYTNIFDMLYYCKEKEDLFPWLIEKGLERRIQPKTLDRYISYIKKRVVEIVLESSSLKEQLQEAIDYPKGRK